MFRLIFLLSLICALCFWNLGCPWICGVFAWLAIVTMMLAGFPRSQDEV